MDVMELPRGGNCPRCGNKLHDPSEDYEYSDSGVPRVVAGFEAPWCAVCGWQEWNAGTSE